MSLTIRAASSADLPVIALRRSLGSAPQDERATHGVDGEELTVLTGPTAVAS
ncbi:hypothetical protein [Isoptericola sediminis]|uniref:Uncharacterized protein n=1 Tax=Isoptericola sediminis TaxID=2733572 RepID=A0A849K4Q1_9MICO|nr:hypothetical protein [Isoptericola sediminis]NNU27380.1 hypothetical protein [Isoptericola sediminis]